MGSFEESSWSREDFSRNYLDKADIYIAERRRMFGLAVSYMVHFHGNSDGLSVVDLGCGDGALAHELLRVNPKLSFTLVDASQDMLLRADERLGVYTNVHFVKASFAGLLDGTVDLGEFDLCVSAQAIHHLSFEEKADLFKYIFKHLSDRGSFLNIDVVRPPSEEIEAWYFDIWRGWMRMKMAEAGLDEDPERVISQFKDPASMNRPDTLEAQLDALRDAGFRDVDCYYKNGIFAVFGGRK